MGRAPCCDKANVKKGPWSPEEDATLKAYIEKNGTGGNWIALPQKIGLKRCGKSCRLRWLNYLRPNIKHGGFTEEEDNIICSLYISIGSRWSIIAAQLPGRTDNDIKNYWNTRLKKKLLGRRKQSSNFNTKDGIFEEKSDNSSNNALSSSALERLQLHMQLQSLQNPFSFYNNPALWPKLHQEKMIQGMQSLNDTSSSNNPMMQNNISLPNSNHVPIKDVVAQQDDAKACILENPNLSSNNSVPSSFAPPKVEGVDNMGVQQVCALQNELDDILNNNRSCYMPQQQQEDQITDFDCFGDINIIGSKDSFIWWSNNNVDSAADTKSASSNSWDSSSTTAPVLLPEGMFVQDYGLGGYRL